MRYIGFTGHKDPRIHLQMLDKPFAWDACQMPINVLDLHYRSFQKEVVPGLPEEERRRHRDEGLRRRQRHCAAAPGLTPAEAYRYALSQPVAAQVVGMTTHGAAEGERGAGAQLPADDRGGAVGARRAR